MRGNYEWKLLQEIMTGNYTRKMWELQGYWPI